MSRPFNAYRDWLKLPEGEDKPHHYALLGLPVFEQDSSRILAAYEERYTSVRRYEVSKYTEEATRVLNELSQAFDCLTNPDRKSTYDTALRTRLGGRITRFEKGDSRETVADGPRPATKKLERVTSQGTVPATPVVPPSLPEGTGKNDWLNWSSEALNAEAQPAALPPTPIPELRTTRNRLREYRFAAALSFGIIASALFLVCLIFLVKAFSVPTESTTLAANATSPQITPIMETERSGALSEATSNDQPSQESLSPETEFKPESPRADASTSPASTDHDARLVNDSSLADASRREDETTAASVPATNLASSPVAEFDGRGSVPESSDPRSAEASDPSNLLDQLPITVDLPALDVRGWQPLIPLPNWPQTVTVDLNDSLANLPGRSHLILTRADTIVDPAWRIQLALEGADAPVGDIAFLLYSPASQVLQIQWAKPQEKIPQGQLANCWLSFKTGERVKKVALRSPISGPRVKLDGNQEEKSKRQMHVTEISNLPRRETLRLEISEVVGFPFGAALVRGRSSCEYGNELRIEFDDFEGAQVAVQLAVQSQNLAVSIEPVFKNGNTEILLFYRTLQKLGGNSERMLAQKVQELQKLNRQIPGLQNELQDAQSAQASNPTEMGIVNRRRNAAASKLGNARGRLRDVQRDLHQLQIVQLRLPQIINLAQRLHQDGALICRITAEADGEVMELGTLGL